MRIGGSKKRVDAQFSKSRYACRYSLSLRVSATCFHVPTNIIRKRKAWERGYIRPEITDLSTEMTVIEYHSTD